MHSLRVNMALKILTFTFSAESANILCLRGSLASHAFRGADMEKEHWDRCPFHANGQCPQQLAIDRMSLIPQLVAPSEIEAARTVCEKCGQRLGDKRKHVRTKRPLEVTLSKGDLPPIQGDIINISQSGALLKLRDWVRFTAGEKVCLEIYSPHSTSSKMPAEGIRLFGLIKRVEAKERKLAVAFLEENDH